MPARKRAVPLVTQMPLECVGNAAEPVLAHLHPEADLRLVLLASLRPEKLAGRNLARRIDRQLGTIVLEQELGKAHLRKAVVRERPGMIVKRAVPARAAHPIEVAGKQPQAYRRAGELTALLQQGDE